MTNQTTNYVYMRQSATDKYQWRYAYLARDNVYQIGSVLASNEPDATRKIWHKTTPIGRQVCITCILSDIHRQV